MLYIVTCDIHCDVLLRSKSHIVAASQMIKDGGGGDMLNKQHKRRQDVSDDEFVAVCVGHIVCICECVWVGVFVSLCVCVYVGSHI